jgi:hypothetical protein
VRSASSSAGFSGGGIARSMERRASSLPNSRLMEDEAGGSEGPGVASDGVGGTEANVLGRRRDCALLREAVVAPRGTGACCCCTSCASSSSSQCLICRWYCIIRRAFCVLGTASDNVSSRARVLIQRLTWLSRYHDTLLRVIISL